MIAAYLKALGQMGDPVFRKVLWIGVATSLVVFILLWIAVGFLLNNTALFHILWLDKVVEILGFVATLAITWFMFPALISTVIGLLLERIADAVEERHYPDLPAAPGLSLTANVLAATRFLVVMILLNLVVLLFLIPPFTVLFPFVFYGVNGYLLGREYFELVALRRISPEEARRMRKRHRTGRLLTGLVAAFLLTVPVVNLVAPILATAAMVHLFEGWRRAATRRAEATV